MAKTAYGYAKYGSSGGSTGGGSYSGGTGISVPKITEFKRVLNNAIEQAKMDNGGILTSSVYDSALAQVEPYIEDSSYLDYYLQLKNDKSKLMQVTEDQNSAALMDLTDFNDARRSIELSANFNPSTYIERMAQAYDDTNTSFETKIDDYRYAGLDTSKLEAAQQKFLSDWSSIKQLVEDYITAGADISKMSGYTWAITTNRIDGSLESMRLVPEDETQKKDEGGNTKYAITNVQYGGLPVYVSKYIKNGQPTVQLADAKGTFNKETDQFDFSNPEMFSPTQLKSNKYPIYEDGSVVKDTAGNLYYKNRDGWYKAETPDDMNEFWKQTHNMQRWEDFGKKDSALFKNLPELTKDNVLALGDFTDPDGKKRIINKEFLGGSRPFMDESVAPEEKVLSDWKIPVGPLNLKVSGQDMGLFGNKLENKFNQMLQPVSTPIRKGVAIGSDILNIAKAGVGSAIGQAQQNVSTGLENIQQKRNIDVGLIAKKAAEMPRKDFVQKATTGLKGMFNTAKSIFGFK